MWLLVGYIAFFAFSQGAVIWVYISEVFPNRVRAKGQSLGSSSHWHERRDLGDLPLDGGKVWRGAVSVFCGYDGGAVFCGVADLPGNEGDFAGADAEEPGDRVAPGVSRDSI